MIQTPPAAKLHTACDECRTRKLKCSGDKPNCTRCQKENLVCIFSVQKQMGRPRKRRRGSDPSGEETLLADVNENLNHSTPSSMLGNFGLITPPQFFDSDLYTADNVNEDLAAISPYLADPNVFDRSPTSNIGTNVENPIDPSLWDESPGTFGDDSTEQMTLAPCNCLSLMYLTVSELQTVQSFEFPQVVTPLRKAMGVLADIIRCKQCPKENFSAMQNTASIVSLSRAIVERFSKVILTIDAETERLERTGGKKPYRIGDNSPELRHLHTGGADCPMGFNIEIGPREFQRLAKTALKTEIYGNGSNPMPLLQLIQEAEVRQERWHNDVQMHCAEREHLFGVRTEQIAKTKCQAIGADMLRLMIGNLRFE
ncbi:hypothetical protein DE146DRAFT_38158 [Phaeosphaeria sp. MPI-PUGE-AT-0046c]|nr:hypothetical protein DE146DRAFT_38158 [Phaeosphaeria sp. MPI-PUGE-AT-0046c]